MNGQITSPSQISRNILTSPSHFPLRRSRVRGSENGLWDSETLTKNSSRMKWEMEMEQIEAVLERIWDLHDKISDAIHAISRAHFLKSIKNLSQSSLEKKHPPNEEVGGGFDERRCGYVFVKGFRADEDAALAEARSLNAIRSALENLEDQIEFFHTIQSQQQAERDAAIARLEQSHIILAMRLSEYQGEKHKVIEEAQAFLSDVQEASQFIAPDNLFVELKARPGKDAGTEKESKPYTLMQMLISSFALVKSSLSLGRFSGVLGNAALFAVSMLTLLQIQQAALKQEAPASSNRSCYRSKSERMAAKVDYSSQSEVLQCFDVYSGRG